MTNSKVKLYILKIKGVAKIPDYLQIRDSEFSLQHYLRLDRLEVTLEKTKYKNKKNQLISLVKKVPFGKLKKIEL